MNAALLMTLPTPQLLNLPARQNQPQTSPRCQEHLINTPCSWWSLTGFQTWPPPSSWGACVGTRKNLFPAPCMTGPTHILSLASAPVPWDPTAPGNHRTADFTSKSWSCGRGSHYMSECMQINVKHTEWGNFCNLNNVAMCLLAFSLME